MYETNRSPFKMIAFVLVVLFIVIGVILLSVKPKNKSGDSASRSLDLTAITSPITKSTDNFTISYSGAINPNVEAVKQPFKIFGLKDLPVSQKVKDKLAELLPVALSRQVTPTYATTFIHINPGSINCDVDDNCSMSVYIDSPETYFSLDFSKVNGAYTPKLIQQPWEGINS